MREEIEVGQNFKLCIEVIFIFKMMMFMGFFFFFQKIKIKNPPLFLFLFRCFIQLVTWCVRSTLLNRRRSKLSRLKEHMSGVLRDHEGIWRGGFRAAAKVQQCYGRNF